MTIKQREDDSPSMVATNYSNVLRLVLFIFLTGCSAPQFNPGPTSAEQTKPSKAKISTTPTKPSTPCVYESTKGVAEVIEINAKQITFKFYPGDRLFTLPAKAITNNGISLQQELKAIIRTPLSGPCENTEFELLSTIE